MDLREEFEHHADECRRMAAGTMEARTKSTWNQMADRWAVAAKNQAQADEQAALWKRLVPRDYRSESPIA
jgi:hypothetical protein